MKNPRPLLLSVVMGLLVACKFVAYAVQVPTFQVYDNSACEGTPTSIVFSSTSYCSSYALGQCATDGHYSYTIACADFSTFYTDSMFSDTQYLITEIFAVGSYCRSIIGAYVWPLNGEDCHKMPPIAGLVGVEVYLNADNSLTTEFATDNTCDDMNHASKFTYPSSVINTNYCVGGHTMFYVRSSTATTSTGVTATGTTPTGIPTTTGTTGTQTTTTTSLSPSGVSPPPQVFTVAMVMTVLASILAP
ncbi:unnamed protein product [Phytophthora fragariaefolia]|uniref:Unnamed protein product n=1 Tax=Phytophthora fragariaefolia TaxID=1490495 RepID=A0A9W7D9Y2_9STRA|nr:unnamed protein product [Phytophthora fragariaefolia]